MNDKTIITQVQNNSGTYEDHLCYIISQGFHLSDEPGYLALISRPKFRCGHCGRQAVSAKNLCVPTKL